MIAAPPTDMVPAGIVLPEASGGWCAHCGRMHLLPPDRAWPEALLLMERLAHSGRIDFEAPAGDADPRCATTPLFAAEGGKMFGVLACRDNQGRLVTLRAFSGQFGGLWEAAGWVGPICDPVAFDRLTRDTEGAIKRLGAEIDQADAGSIHRQHLVRRRRALSRDLMRKIHDLYRLINFRGEHCLLIDAFQGDSLPPSGTGDCCAVKLLHHAAKQGLRPLGLVEFYWGRPNASGGRVHGGLYPACAARCRPVLGFMLCGLAGENDALP